MNSSGKDIPFPDAVKITLSKIKGSYALGILYEGDETCFIGARNEAPLVIGLGEGEYFIASDIPPILPYTRDFIFMEDGEVAVLSSKGVKVYDAKGDEVQKNRNGSTGIPSWRKRAAINTLCSKRSLSSPGP